ncbi:hypothetical protein MBT84_02405 [Streptomyces sp. MBT84]|nr:hypothetical protein [Streptomyces sp. MBT84]
MGETSPLKRATDMITGALQSNDAGPEDGIPAVSPGMGSDAYGARDAKGRPAATSQSASDPRVALLLSEAFRHGKAIGAWASGERALEAAGVPTDAPGVLVGDSGTTVLEQLTSLLGAHRVWERFTVGD